MKKEEKAMLNLPPQTFQKDIAFLSVSALYTSLEVMYTSLLQLWVKKHGAYRSVGKEVYENDAWEKDVTNNSTAVQRRLYKKSKTDNDTYHLNNNDSP